MNEAAATIAAAPKAGPPASVADPRTGSLTRRMIVIAAAWIVALLLIGGFALDRVLTSSIVDNFDDQLEFMSSTAMIARVRDRPRRRGALQPPAGRPALPRALFGPLFPDQRRRGRRPSPRARCGTGGCGSRPATSDVQPHIYDSNEFSTAGIRAAAHRRARRGPARERRALALPGRAVARDARRADQQVSARP